MKNLYKLEAELQNARKAWELYRNNHIAWQTYRNALDAIKDYDELDRFCNTKPEVKVQNDEFLCN